MAKRNKDRGKTIAEWEAKGTEWLAGQLWNAREETRKARETADMYRYEAHHERAREYSAYVLQKANSLMAKVLENNGITPTRLRVTFIDCDCDNCPGNGSTDGNWECYECGEKINGEIYRETETKYIESIAFWEYCIKGNEMTGINAAFENSVYEVIKVVDEKTGEVIYQNDLYPEATRIDGDVADEQAETD